MFVKIVCLPHESLPVLPSRLKVVWRRPAPLTTNKKLFKNKSPVPRAGRTAEFNCTRFVSLRPKNGVLSSFANRAALRVQPNPTARLQLFRERSLPTERCPEPINLIQSSPFRWHEAKRRFLFRRQNPNSKRLFYMCRSRANWQS